MTRNRSDFERPMQLKVSKRLRGPRGLAAFGLVALAASWAGTAAAQQSAPITYAGSRQVPLMNRQKEVALALSACPPSVASKAAVYVLEESGYVKVRDSQNGFTAIVGHVLPNSVEPQCMNAEGARTHLPPILKIAGLRAQGKSDADIKRAMAEAYANGTFPPPTALGVDYMLSTENIVPNFRGGVGPYPPHVMFFAPGITNADLGGDIILAPGADNPSGPAFVVNQGTPQAIIIVPVEVHAGPANPAAHNHSGSSQ